MKIEIDDQSGFCFGVVNAITKAEQSLVEGGEVFCLGDIVHNRMEVQRLERLGLKCVRHEVLQGLCNATVLIRAHGEPPSTYELAKRNGLKIIDATCKVVARLQRLVKKAYQQMQPIGGQVIILGKRGHAEVIGLTGQVDGDAFVVENLEDLEAVDFNRPIYLLSQTTQSLWLFRQVSEQIMARAKDPSQVTIHDTICRRVSDRESHLQDFAHRFDVIIFVSGKKSSNGQVLFEVCKKANPRSYTVESEAEIEREWFENCESVGICGATSTPGWLMRLVGEYVGGLHV